MFSLVHGAGLMPSIVALVARFCVCLRRHVMAGAWSAQLSNGFPDRCDFMLTCSWLGTRDAHAHNRRGIAGSSVDHAPALR